MTNEVAIREILRMKSEMPEAVDLAVIALRKQVPKKPRTYIAFDGIERNGCPTCPRNEILYAGQKYCSVCGQKICWGEDEDDN